MRRRNVLQVATLWYSLVLLACCGLWRPAEAFAQTGDRPVWKFTRAKMAVEPLTNVTENSFTATWSNVPYQQVQNGEVFNQITYRLLVTREITAPKNGVYPITNAVIKGNPSGQSEVINLKEAYWNNQLSQPGWIGLSSNWTPDGVSIKATQYAGLPGEAITGLARVISPIMDLSNNDGTFTFKFTAKVLNASADVPMEVFGYGYEMSYPNGVPDVQKISIPNDGKPHPYSFTFKNGTWCHTLVIAMAGAAEVEFTDGFYVTQNLKEGDRAFRSTYFGGFEFEKAKPLDQIGQNIYSNDVYRLRYSMDFPDVDPKCLDLAAAKTDGERVGCRMIYDENQPGYSGRILTKPMFSDPVYFDNQPAPENNYIYLGYAKYENPTYVNLHPGMVTFAGHHGGAIKATKELLKDNIGNRVVGLRFVTAACMQDKQVNNHAGWLDVKGPFIYLAKTLKTTQEGTATDTIMTTQTEVLKDGWNTVFFNEPLEITAESEFFAGFHAYDAAEVGGIAVGSLLEKATDPNAAYIGTNWSTSRFDEAIFSHDLNSFSAPLLIQLIIEPKTQDPAMLHKGELTAIKAPTLIYDTDALDATVTLYNTGIRTINSATVEVQLGDTKKDYEITLPDGPQATQEQNVIISGINHDGVLGQTTLKVTLKKVNGEALATSTSVSAQLEIVKKDDVFERNALIESFTSEECKYCPDSEQAYEDMIMKPENEELAKRIVTVVHHTFFSPDFLALDYSFGLQPFYGIVSQAGEVGLVNPTSPTIMINRIPNPALGTAKGQNGSIYAHMGGLQSRLNEAMQYATETHPATVKAQVKPFFDKEAQKLKVAVYGNVSSRYDSSLPLHVTIMITQDEINTRRQVWDMSPTPGYKHRNVLRIVDEAGFKGTPVEIQPDGSFTFTTEMTVNTTDAQGTLPQNTLLLEGDNKTLEDVLDDVNVIAVLHRYEALPTQYDVEPNDQRLLKNEVLNVAQRRVSFTDFTGVDAPAPADVTVYVENRSVCVSAEVENLQVYSLSGVLVPNENLMPGTYVVSFTLNGQTVLNKVLVR